MIRGGGEGGASGGRGRGRGRTQAFCLERERMGMPTVLCKPAGDGANVRGSALRVRMDPLLEPAVVAT